MPAEEQLAVGQYSKNFFDYEFFDSNSGTVSDFDIWKARYLAQNLLQPPRTAFDEKMTVNSGKRGKAHNTKIGGSKTSDHMYLNETAAVDIKLSSGADNKEVFEWMVNEFQGKEIFGQLIAYVDLAGRVRFIHVSKPSNKRIDNILLARYTFEDNAGKQKYAVYQGEVVRP